MSLNGLKQFDENLRTMMDSKAFNKADDVDRLRMSEALLRSNYGVGSPFNIPCKIKSLKDFMVRKGIK